MASSVTFVAIAPTAHAQVTPPTTTPVRLDAAVADSFARAARARSARYA